MQPVTVIAPEGPVRFPVVRVCEANAVQAVADGATSILSWTCLADDPNEDFGTEKLGGLASAALLVWVMPVGLPLLPSTDQVNVAVLPAPLGRSVVLVVVRVVAVNRMFAALLGSLTGSATFTVYGATTYLYGLIEYVASDETMTKLGGLFCARFGP